MAFLWHLETERLDLSASDDPYIQIPVRLSGNRTPCPRGLQMSKRAVFIGDFSDPLRNRRARQKNTQRIFFSLTPEKYHPLGPPHKAPLLSVCGSLGYIICAPPA